MSVYVGPRQGDLKPENIYNEAAQRIAEKLRRQQRLEAAKLLDRYANDPQMVAALQRDAGKTHRPLPISLELKENTVPTESTVDTKIKVELQKRRDEREVAKRLALVDAFGEDPFEPGAVLTFVKEFASTKGDPYTYAAIKAAKGDKWFITGHDCYQGTTLTWDGLIEFLVTGPYPVASVTVKVEGGDVYPSAGNVYPTASKDK